MKNNNFREISLSTAILYGLSDGEYAVGEVGGDNTLAMRIPVALRKRNTSAFTAGILESIEYDGFPNETGFYPVRKGGKIVLAFYHGGRLEVISREFARDVRLSGGIIDVDADVERKEVKKHLDHMAAESRRLRKELNELRKELTNKAPEEEPNIDEEVERLLRRKKTGDGGLRYEAPKSTSSDDDDDDAWI